MKVSAEPIENSQVALNVEMEATEVDEYLEEAYGRLVRKVSVPGFRKGKTPRAVLERHIGKDALFREALEQLIPKAYAEALENQSIDAIDQPQIELVQAEPLIFKATVPVRPTVKLGDYKKIRLESKSVEISDEDVRATIEQLRHQQAVLLPVERAVQYGDIVTMDVEDKRNGEYVPIGKSLVYEVNIDAKMPLPGFAEKLEGANKDEEKSFVLSYPPDYEIKELAGKEHSFKVKITEVKEKQLPVVDDEFAKSLGSEDMASLREQITSGLKARGEERAQMELERKAVDAVVELSAIEYPPILVERGIDRLLNDEARNFPEGAKGMEDYLRNLNKTIDDHREELRPVATRRVVRSLVLDKIAEAENIEVSDSEVDNEIDKMVKDSGQQAEELRKFFGLVQARESVKQALNSRKTLACLVEIATSSA
jgi:trigger factor